MTMTYEIAPGSDVPVSLVDEASHGDVVYLVREHKSVAAIVPIETQEDYEDMMEIAASYAEPGELILLEDLKRELGFA